MTGNQKKQLAVMGRMALLVTTIIWGTSFVVLKNTLDFLSTPYVLAFRFSGAAVLLFLLSLKDLKKLDRQYLKGGALMGIFVFLAYTVQTYGLEYTTPGKNAFLTATYCVLVPFLAWAIYRKRPDIYNILAAVICVAGVGFVTLGDDLSLNIGDALTLCCGVFYGLHILITGRYVEGRSAILMTFLQFAFAGILAWILALLTGPVPTNIPGDSILSIVYLCAMCTAISFAMQAFGQKHTPASAAAVILSLESVFGALFSAIFYHEKMGLKLLVGFVLIFAAVTISETKLEFLRRRKKHSRS